MEKIVEKKAYEKPVMLASEKSFANEGACGRNQSCGELVRKY